MATGSSLVRNIWRQFWRRFLPLRPVLSSTDFRNQTAVCVKDVSKRFKIYHNARTGLLKELLFPWKKKQYYSQFFAVRNVSLDIRRGEVVGVIGPNGAGKSTLLKMVAGLLPVDQGQIHINGKVTAVMAMGVGAHPEFTGRENILYGAMLLGMSKRDVLRKMPSIIEFSELEDYIDRPLRTYSSGMTARLLFSIAMSVEPDILIVDEALATGDQRFVDKCVRRIKEFAARGVTIFFVSHNLGLVQDLCHRAVLMNQGEAVFIGEPEETIKHYQHLSGGAPVSLPAGGKLESVSGSGQVKITNVRMLNEKGRAATEFTSNDQLTIELSYERTDSLVEQAHVTVGFMTAQEHFDVGETSTRQTSEEKIELASSGSIRFKLSPLLLTTNHFSLWVKVFGDHGTYCEYRNLHKFFVNEPGQLPTRESCFKHPSTITHVPGEGVEAN